MSKLITNINYKDFSHTKIGL